MGDSESISKPSEPHGLVLEGWAQGFMVGALIIMAGITVANMRRNVLLHKLIFVELLFGIPHGTFMFADAPVYGWYLSVTAIFLNVSWSMHNIVAWMKNKPFLSRRVSRFYIGTVILAQPYWVLEIYANFAYFNNINRLFHYTRPYEAIFRDPWWIFTSINLFWNIKRRYEFGFLELMRVSPRFTVLLTSMILSVVFIVVDILSVTSTIKSRLPEGINPFWKLAFIFKCFTDTIILDDFKTALDKLKEYKLEQMTSGTPPGGSVELPGPPLELYSRTVTPDRRTSSLRPWNESRGVTSDDKHRKRTSPMDAIDLEMGYWTNQGQDSHASN